jgi:hypothetical protein
MCSIKVLEEEFGAIQKLLAFLITSILDPHLEHARLVAGLVRGVKSGHCKALFFRATEIRVSLWVEKNGSCERPRA